MLDLFRAARGPEEFRALLPRALRRADGFAEQVRRGAWPVEELVISHRIGQASEAFVTFTDSVAALRQLEQAGAVRQPGQVVRYVVLDRTSRSFRERVRPEEFLEGGERYDPDAYLELLARAAETLLVPFGVERDGLLERWGYGGPVERGPYRSPEHVAQSVLDARALGGAG